MRKHESRRRRLPYVTLGALALLGCVDRHVATGDGRDPVVADRPVVHDVGAAAVSVDALGSERPVAYVSMATRQVFVDRAHRDRASWLFDAHISVSTQVWRIPLPGDEPSTPIPPGDERREFEERPIDEWDPTRPPANGDIRILLGRRVPVRLDLACVAVRGASGALSSETLETERVLAGRSELGAGGGAAPEPLREDFGVLGRGRRHQDPACADSGREVPILGWSARH